MGLARAHAIALVGVQGHPVEIEADIENGMVALLLVGLPDTALREARDRIRSAIVNSGESWPSRRITVGLSPASLPKRGSGFDLGIAMAILAAAESVPAAGLNGLVLIGELGLDGRVRPVPGVLPAAAAAAAAGFAAVAVAVENAAEAALVPELRVIAAPSLAAFTAWIRNGQPGSDGAVQVLEPGRDIAALFEAIHDPASAASRSGVRSRARACTGQGSRRSRRAARSQACRRDLCRRRAPPDAARTAGRRQDDARRADSDRPAAARARGGARGQRHPLGGGDASARPAARHRAAVLRAASHRDPRGDRRRGERHHQAGRGFAGSPWLPVPGRGAGIRPRRARRAAPAAGIWRGRGGQGGCDRPLPGEIHAHHGGEPVCVRECTYRRCRLQLHSAGPPPVPGAAIGPAARPGRCQDRVPARPAC